MRDKSSLVDEDKPLSKEEQDKIIYTDQVFAMNNPPQGLQEKMLNLMELGFMDFNKNQELLIKFKGNLEVVAEALFNG